MKCKNFRGVGGKPIQAPATPYRAPRVMKPSTRKVPALRGDNGYATRNRPVTTR